MPGVTLPTSVNGDDVLISGKAIELNEFFANTRLAAAGALLELFFFAILTAFSVPRAAETRGGCASNFNSSFLLIVFSEITQIAPTKSNPTCAPTTKANLDKLNFGFSRSVK